MRAPAASLAALLLASPVAGAEFRFLDKDGVVGRLRTLVTHSEDTLLDIARKHDLGYSEIAAANPDVDPWVPGEGTQIVLPTEFVLPPGPRSGLVVNLVQLRLFYFPPRTPGEPPRVITHPIGIGVDVAPTPVAATRVVRKAVDPTWYPPESIRKRRAEEGEILPDAVAPGPDNPLGRYALYLGLSGYLIHGTDRPWGIGMRVSSGCIRLYPEDIERLYQRVPIGTPVRIVREPYVVGLRRGVPVLQAFSPLEDGANEESYTPLMQALIARFPRGTVDPAKALQVAKEKRGVPTPIGPAR